MESGTERVDVRALAVVIAEHLQGWSVSRGEANDHHAALKREDGPELWLGFSRREGRIHVTGSWPRDERHGSYAPHSGAPSITVAAGREPKAIVREIERRFLPSFLPMWHAAEARRGDAEAANDAAEALACRLRDVFGLPHPEPSRYESRRDAIHISKGNVTFEVRRYGGVKVEVTTSDSTRVLQLAEALRGFGLHDE